MESYLDELIQRIPEKPGIYQYLDEKGVIIYVGKAKNLKKRVQSYFNKSHDDSPKTRLLVRKIRDIKYIVVDNEQDALLLENNLIKQFQPRYNVLLKDDKSYPSLCIKKEPFPRVLLTRRILQDGSEYFGPYSSVSMVKTLLSLIRQVYPLRTCKLSLSEKEIESGKYKVCLEYHIHKCLGPCIGEQTAANYEANIADVREILKGNIQLVSQHLLKEMQQLANELRFEEAQQLKEKYELIEQYRSKSTIVNSGLDQIDVFGYDDFDQSAIINYLHLSHGCIVQAFTLEYRKRVEESKETLLASAVYEFRQRFHSQSQEIIVPFMPEFVPENVIVHIPSRGDKKKVLDLSQQNARQYKLDLLKQQEKLNPEQRSTRLLTTVKNDLHLAELPRHIECFDNSNIQGTAAVASCVVFKNGKPSKKDYRHFNIKTVEGPDDYASMYEVVTRRYPRLLDEGQELPQLIVVDGGKGQLSMAVKALEELHIYHKITVIGIAKQMEELYFPQDPVPLYLDKQSETLRLIRQLRDEAHRFGITHHRKRRSHAQLTSRLDEIPGIGEKTKTLLLQHFKSVSQLKKTDLATLTDLVGKDKAQKIVVFLQQEN
jgi:excinuclease ABC subunit C